MCVEREICRDIKSVVWKLIVNMDQENRNAETINYAELQEEILFGHELGKVLWQPSTSYG